MNNYNSKKGQNQVGKMQELMSIIIPADYHLPKSRMSTQTGNKSAPDGKQKGQMHNYNSKKDQNRVGKMQELMTITHPHKNRINSQTGNKRAPTGEQKATLNNYNSKKGQHQVGKVQELMSIIIPDHLHKSRMSTQTGNTRAPEGEQAPEPMEDLEEKEAAAPDQVQLEAPEPMEDLKEELDDDLSKRNYSEENVILRDEVTVLEKKAKLNEALQKESQLKIDEEISKLEIQLSLKNVTESETGHKLKQLEEALQVQKEGTMEAETTLDLTLQWLKTSQEDTAMSLAHKKETGDRLQAALTEALTKSNSQQLQMQEERDHLLRAMSEIKRSLEETRVVQKPKKLSLRKRFLQFFRRTGGQEAC
ncbi:hypothetical protein EYF80_021809 [Liparis tanakae]|uniref:Uncharacterized protein n=1 Tax=Liparis tanakae TaxID=230148 RepID=A0A4Z2HQM0_9TELE|nr:hypothetical protein EYF80_021809 [Liparis tanakae]